MWPIFASLSAVSAAFGTILQKEVLKKLHAAQLMTISTGAALLLMLPLMFFYNVSADLKTLVLILIYSIGVSFATIFSVRALRHLDVSVVAPFFNLGTALTAILAFFIFRESLTWVDWVGISLLILGGYMLELKGKNLLQPIKDIMKSKSIHYLLGSVTLFSVAYLLAKFILEGTQPVTMLFYQQIFCFLIFLGITFFYYGGIKDIKIGIKNGSYLVFLMSAVIIAENFLIFEALKVGDASLVVPLYRTWTLWAVIFGGRLFHENHILKRSFSAILMILGAALILVW